jgi:regulator of protease activity HflC (stomatin/prohibitin superfamily)
MSAERERRATVTQADGSRHASITVAEGEKQAAILKAEGDQQAQILRAEAEKQAQILTAEGERQAALLHGEGFAMGLDKIYNVAKQVDANTLNLQYLDALKAIGASPSSKWILPLEVTSLLRPFASLVSRASEES